MLQILLKAQSSSHHHPKALNFWFSYDDVAPFLCEGRFVMPVRDKDRFQGLHFQPSFLAMIASDEYIFASAEILQLKSQLCHYYVLSSNSGDVNSTGRAVP